MTEGEDTAAPEGEPAPPDNGRRKLLKFAALMVAPIALFRGASWVFNQAVDDLGFIPVDDPPGFRRLSLIGSTSSALDPFLGLAAPGEVDEPVTTIAEQDFCVALFGGHSIPFKRQRVISLHTLAQTVHHAQAELS